MSATATKWAQAQRVHDTTLTSVLRSLAWFSDKDTGECRKSQGDIARHSGCTDRSVRHSLVILEKLELVTRRRRSKGKYGRDTDLVILSLDRNFDVSRAAIQALRKAIRQAVQPEQNSGSDKVCNRNLVPLQPEPRSREYNQGYQDRPYQGEKFSDLSKGTYTPEGHGWDTSDWYHDLPANVTPLRARGGAA